MSDVEITAKAGLVWLSRISVALLLTLVAFGGVHLGDADAESQSQQVELLSNSCTKVKISKNVRAAASIVAKDYRLGAVNLEQSWCFDGQKITSVAEPKVWTSSTAAGGATLQWRITDTRQIPHDPQNGGYWTNETFVTGSLDTCVLKYGCIYNQPFTLDLYVFGDGVHHNASPGNIG